MRSRRQLRRFKRRPSAQPLRKHKDHSRCSPCCGFFSAADARRTHSTFHQNNCDLDTSLAILYRERLGSATGSGVPKNRRQSPVSYGTSTTRHDSLPPRVIIDATCSTTRVVLPDVESVVVYRPPSSIPSSHLGQELLDLLGHKRHIRRIGPSARCKEVSTSNASILRNATQRNRSDTPAWPHTLSITASSASLSCDTSLTLSSGWCRDARQE